MSSLIHFHRFLITAGIIFCLGFASWVFLGFLEHGGVGRFSLAMTFFVAGLLLSIYLRKLRQFLNLPPSGTGPAGRQER